PQICDYEGSDYRTRFWEAADRAYEDAADRIALARLLPPRGERLIEIGAGFGRLADLYTGYQQVILLDYATSQLRQAQERLGRDDRFLYVAANLYHLPLADSVLDTAITVRVLHHVQDLPAAFREIGRVLKPGGTYVLDYANKRHLKAVLRYLLGRQRESPFSLAPYAFVPLNYDFHPAYVEARLREAGFALQRQLAVSSFRLPLLKRLLGHRVLAALEELLQGPTAPLKLAPSIFIRATIAKADSSTEPAGLWRCPRCGGTEVAERKDGLECFTCNTVWPLDDGIYDFKTSSQMSVARSSDDCLAETGDL
ncbi:MAG TPA: class I SAM-dependent methyltransferase, partial [Anaerolineae bacterium]|nr:class I SAM-dependent methyltransferase [Anaerolineae bacterium]